MSHCLDPFELLYNCSDYKNNLRNYNIYITQDDIKDVQDKNDHCFYKFFTKYHACKRKGEGEEEEAKGKENELIQEMELYITNNMNTKEWYYPHFITLLGLLYYELNPEKARMYIEVASTSYSHYIAMYVYSIMLQYGIGGSVSMQECFQYRQKCCEYMEYTHTVPLLTLALTYSTGDCHNIINIKHASHIYKFLIKKRQEPDAMYQLSLLYIKSKKFIQARYLLRQGCLLNHANCLNMYANMLRRGQGGKKKIKKARQCLEKAIQQNLYYAINNLAFSYEQDEPVDYELAHSLYQHAIGLNDEVAMYNYGNMLESGRGCAININQAMQYYKQSADLHHSAGIYAYAQILEQQDIKSEEATRYFLKLYKQDSNYISIVLLNHNHNHNHDTELCSSKQAIIQYIQDLQSECHNLQLQT